MATHSAINPQLLNEAWQISGFSTKKDTINQALIEFIQHRRQLEVLELFGQCPADQHYDYKKARQ